MRKHVNQTGTHKIITRSRYLRSCSPILAEKLKEMLEEHRRKGEGK